jgi:hypothetical protein
MLSEKRLLGFTSADAGIAVDTRIAARVSQTYHRGLGMVVLLQCGAERLVMQTKRAAIVPDGPPGCKHPRRAKIELSRAAAETFAACQSS